MPGLGGGREGGGSGTLPFGDARIDAHLPGGGLGLGLLHEIGADGLEAEIGALGAGLAAWLAARILRHAPGGADQVVLWAASCCDLYAPGLVACGIDPGALILARCANDAETLQVMHIALRSGAACAVLGEVGEVPRLAGRRLHMACLGQGGTALLLRRWPHGRRGASDCAGAATRWRIGPAPTLLEDGPEHPAALIGARRWQLELLHARGGRPGRWLMERPEQDEPVEMGDAYALHVAAVLGDDPAAARPRRRDAA